MPGEYTDTRGSTAADLLYEHINKLREALREIAWAPVCDDVVRIKDSARQTLMASHGEFGTAREDALCAAARKASP